MLNLYTMMPFRLIAIAIYSLLGGLLSSCQHLPSVADRQRNADEIANQHGWQRTRLATDTFQLTSYMPTLQSAGSLLTIYLEGDGLAWITRTQASLNPTPITPVALQLALAQPSGNAVYLARPCQYQSEPNTACSQRLWTSARFSSDVLEATQQAIEQLKSRYHATQLQLVGYSGGGTLAALVAAQRSDVRLLITVAAPLDHHAWSQQLKLSPLRDSLNPADFFPALNHVPQWHLSGRQDTVVPSHLNQDFVRRLNNPQQGKHIVIEDFNHQCCWAQLWPQLWAKLTTDSLD